MNKELMWSESVEQVTYEMVAGKKKQKNRILKWHVQSYLGVTQR